MTIAEMILLGLGESNALSVLGDEYKFKAAAKDAGPGAAHPRARG